VSPGIFARIFRSGFVIKTGKKSSYFFYFHLATNQFFAYISSSTQGAVLLNIKLTIIASRSAPRVSSPPFPGGRFLFAQNSILKPRSGLRPPAVEALGGG
jgi:hypothetical protein